MKFSINVLLLSCITIVTCTAVSSNSDDSDDSECRWTGCEGLLRSGDGICEEYGTGTYTGRSISGGCKWDTRKVQCCKETPQKPGCKWTGACYGDDEYNGNIACDIEFGKGYKPSKKSERCPIILFMTKYECCPR